ncbi:bifunctional hydroxymethylpyrimidine kinase/phosphomethylpyrimidine kinase [Paenibacillus sp. PK4536]|uniref:bifunctional hydroxymethylpyrimidine kinase/phosphomethylpyrimidine kinase n=1 Tax=Paenibacillus sp. PK4536 TaxID=3024576 RepID=UPI00235A230C|nr:bifunctional hydroxymethylpyrimidine kinase/phosphomethylpyrimidine kinase [Paenibacillus sp. PK4536]WIM41004.1 bifunctional hydroxymethylpyrimidine kinase/phosphomethylpyrimidine kinase [Paenibacillus sp. PK4536]
MSVYQALTIAGSDSGGGAGIQADLKTFQELGVYGMSVLTAVTAQNTKGVQGVYPVEIEGIIQQLDSIGTDLQPHAVKTGMLFSAEIIRHVAQKVKQYQWQHLVIDPVMVAKGGSVLLQQEALQALVSDLIPLAEIITPNLPEAELLTGISITNMQQREQAATQLIDMGATYVVIKGGHDALTSTVVDLLYDGQHFEYFESKRIDTMHTHGTGCTFSAALTATLAQGKSIHEAVDTAKQFIQAAIEDGLGIGSDHGPTNHFAYQQRSRVYNV